MLRRQAGQNYVTHGRQKKYRRRNIKLLLLPCDALAHKALVRNISFTGMGIEPDVSGVGHGVT